MALYRCQQGPFPRPFFSAFFSLNLFLSGLVAGSIVGFIGAVFTPVVYAVSTIYSGLTVSLIYTRLLSLDRN